MAGDGNQAGGIGGDISVDGAATGMILTSGQKITAILAFSGPDAAERQQVLEALASIRADLARCAGTKVVAAQTLAEAAVDVGQKDNANRDEIGGLLETGLKSQVSCRRR